MVKNLRQALAQRDVNDNLQYPGTFIKAFTEMETSGFEQINS